MPVNPERPQSLLLIRTSAMGDVAMLRPVLIGFQRRYPEVQLSLLTDPFFQPIFADVEGLDILAFNKAKHGNLQGLLHLYRELRGMKHQAVLDLHNVLRSRVLSALFLLEGTRVARLDKGRSERKELLRRGWRQYGPLKPVHQRYAEAFQQLGYELGESDLTIGGPWVIQPHPPRQRIGIAPFAKHPGKAYPLDLMREVVEDLLAQTQANIDLYGARGRESEVLQEWEDRWPERVHNLAFSLDFPAQLNSMKALSLMISMDSANGHLAANMGTPVLTVWGTTHPYAGFAPFAQPEKNQLVPDPNAYPQLPASIFGPCKDPHYLEAIRSIPPESIARRAIELLDEVRSQATAP